jgi:signal peptidase II
MRTLKKAALIVLILCSCVGCDQVTKSVARNHLASSSPIHLMEGMFRLQYSENPGAFMSLGMGLPDSVRFWLLIICVGVALTGMLQFVLFSREMDRFSVIAASLIIGGGFSNLLDRLYNDGLVVDFMNAGVGSVRTGIFNLADVAIMAGSGMLVYWSLFVKKLSAELETRRGE